MIDINEAPADTSIGIRAISHTALDRALPELALLLRDVVNDTGGLGFLPPMADDEALNYWLSHPRRAARRKPDPSRGVRRRPHRRIGAARISEVAERAPQG
jgi:hypothetical protein